MPGASAQRSCLAAVTMQPSAPSSWRSAPVPWSRAKVATPPVVDAATYTNAPSGLTTIDSAPSSPSLLAHAPPLPDCELQPSSPGSWRSAPVAGSRANAVTASLRSATA